MLGTTNAATGQAIYTQVSGRGSHEARYIQVRNM